jgi:hypothetical protein
MDRLRDVSFVVGSGIIAAILATIWASFRRTERRHITYQAAWDEFAALRRT